MAGYNETQTHGSGQSVNIVISGAIKWWLIPIVALLFFCMGASISANLKANQAIKVSEDQQTEARMVQFWLTQTKVRCDARGFSTPALPSAYAK